MTDQKQLNIKIFADCANKPFLLEMNETPYISGFTTNPTLMKVAGIKNFKAFSLDILSFIKHKPISLQLLSFDEKENLRHAFEIASWGGNVFVKVPILNIDNRLNLALIKKLSSEGIQLNVTAVMNLQQFKMALSVLNPNVDNFISIFAGRIADTGRDPIPIIEQAVKLVSSYPKVEIIWASSREFFNIIQAQQARCQIICVSEKILQKYHLMGIDLNQYALDTVKMFNQDVLDGGLKFE